MGKPDCMDEGAKYGAAATSVAVGLEAASVGLATPVAVALPVIGGLYGCFVAGDGAAQVQAIWRETRRTWRVTKRVIGRAWRWIMRDGRPKVIAPRPLTTDEAMSVVAASFEHRDGPGLHLLKGNTWHSVEARHILSASTLSELYGEEFAAMADAKKVAALWWGFWKTTLRQRPEWGAETRLLFVVFRTGDWLRRAPVLADGSILPIEAWPLMPVKDDDDPSASSLAIMGDQDAPEVGIEVPTERGATMPWEAPLWALVGRRKAA